LSGVLVDGGAIWIVKIVSLAHVARIMRVN
jgi:hypothetical protein